jgi:hypothetical protein
MIHLVKEPLVSSPNGCDCNVCELGLFASLRMAREAYDKLHTNLFPLSIPEERNGPTCTKCVISSRSGQWEMSFVGFGGSGKGGLLDLVGSAALGLFKCSESWGKV